MAPQEPPARPELTVVTGLQDDGTEWPGRRQDESPERQPEPIVVLLSGPNLGLLGQRQPEIYGRDTLADHVSRATTVAAEYGLALEHVQSDYEGALIEAVHDAHGPRRCDSCQPRCARPLFVVAARCTGRLRRAGNRASPDEPQAAGPLAAFLCGRPGSDRGDRGVRYGRVPSCHRSRGGVATFRQAQPVGHRR